ncbi:LuxR family transcriptional regulator [Nocardioides sp. Root1257]|uniref:helix-turn-helix transcriptional regulator n=1 Tax=unclassified Nocardioides TaxID=2615069 RepID=UPI0006F50002|nr:MULTISPECIES: helix-turn-helix transcriptional regulator [unclassified Nocardioides]KQW50964.1 LuxR family transcriptional regulator [Nocardioides sp. Root1257]KRC53760.1 LuxR family transcriptional regulator [Nocardioides sp. Root224]
MLVGRHRESAHLADLLEQARHGAARCVVVRGEPGVGKSALVEDLVSASGDVTVLRTQGVQAEAPLAFAALHRLLLPLTRLREGLPAPQERALRVAFGEEDGPSVEPFLVAVATLSLLSAAAEEQTVLCVVEDAHWLDAATSDALLFCARRLGADRVLLVFSLRDDAGSFHPGGLDELVMTGLEDNASRELLGQRVGGVLAPGVADRLVQETGGNPLALLELPPALTASQLEGAAPLPEQLPLSSRVEAAFLDRSRALPTPTQTALLVVAADDTGDLTTVRRAVRALGVAEEAVEEAVASGLLVADAQTLRVRHPLVRSAVYQAATGTQRRAVHLALADALTVAGDADRATWHRASAAEGPDLKLVAALQDVGARAARRGAYASALAAYERAAALTTDSAQQAALTFAAARNAWASGQAEHARTLALAARQSAVDPVLLADIARLLGRVEVNLGSAVDAHRIFVETARTVSAFDQPKALEMAVAAAIMRTYGADSGARLADCDVDAEPVEGNDPRTLVLKQLFVAMTLAAEHDWAGATSALDVGLEAGDEVVDLDVLGNLGNAALQLGADAAQQHFYALTLSRARDTGAVLTVVYALHRLCFGYLVAGDWPAVRSSAQEALNLAETVGQRQLRTPALAWLTLLAARQAGDDFDTLLTEVDEATATYPLGILGDPVHDLVRWAKGARAADAGDASGALHHLSRLRVPALTRMAAVDRTDAAVRAGAIDTARRWVDELAPFADATGRPWALGAVAYGRAMTTQTASETDSPPDMGADGLANDPDTLFREALAQYATAGRPFDEARTHLAYGEWLRRAQRRVDAREHLRRATETFADLRAVPLTERANAELRASGETARKRDPSTLVDLTPMELKVAQLVSTGLSNKDVAAQIWVSPRTVAFHLRNVFAKAGISSRGELAQLDLG